MKKIISIVLTFAFVMSFMTGCGAAEQTTEETEKFMLTMQIGTPTMKVNGEEKNIDENGTAPIVENNRTLVPIRAIIEAMGGVVAWDEQTETATLTLKDDVIELVVGSETALFNGESNILDVTPKIINGRTMLPLRFIADKFKFKVLWDNDTRTITITEDSEENDTAEGGKTLVVYYSASGNTERVANYIKNAANADIFELEPVDEYASEDLDWTDKSSRVNTEHDDESKRDIALKSTTIPNFDKYDTVFIGYPIWWGIAAWPVNKFVKDNDFTNKTVIPFCTSSSSDLGESGKLLSEMAGTGDWQDGKRFYSGANESDVEAWVESLNLAAAN